MITTRAYAHMVLHSLHACAEIRGIGTHAMPLTHPDAWRTLTISRFHACTVPVAMDASDIRPDVIQRIQTHSSQHMTRWVGMPVTVSVAVVNATLLQRKG